MPSPKEITHQLVRSKILAVARQCLDDRGPANLSLREIARMSGYSPAALYEYFRNKEAIMAAMAAEFETNVIDALEGIPADLPLHDRLMATCISFIRLARRQPQLYQLTYGLQVEGQKDNGNTHVRGGFMLTALEILFDEGVKIDYFKPHPGFGAREMAFAGWSLVQGLASMQIEKLGEDLDYDLLNIQSLETFITGLQIRMDHEG